MTGIPIGGRTARLVAGASYPVVMAAGFVLYLLLEDAGLAASPAAYAAVFTCVIMIALHERLLPCRTEWRPDGKTVGTDALYVVAVQIALPYLLAVSVVVWLARALQAAGYTVDGYWPHHLPAWAQIVLMLLAADFLRYWMHRGFHKYTPLWRLHAVHHSPHGLYWLNVGRFHPIEKMIQYAVDALPFALVGVSGEVLAGYFVFYAINGFYQHSNCLVRLGPLNYLVSGPELHRWHHSELPQESDTNFGNNLIVWDLIFGTRFLPNDREVASLGLRNRSYPTGFLAQMRTPFIAGLEEG